MADEPIDAVAEFVAEAGIGGRRLRQVIARLTESPARIEDLIRDFAVPRRSVEVLLRAAGEDLHTGGESVMLREESRRRYRERFGFSQLRERRQVTGMQRLIAAAPAGDQALDHVSATAETAARRAVWLDETFDLAGAHLVCVGDHDLTSLAVAMLNPDVRISVVDVDDRLLEYIAGQRLPGLPGPPVRPIDCWHADLRFGLPPALAGSADIVFTDPPYTPEGVQLFLGRGAQALGDRVNGRLVMAYGFSPLTPALGLKVQRAVLDLDLVLEAMLPSFNRYHGAQAVGSASDLYVCRPTAHTWQILDRRLSKVAVNIYTHGGQSLEAPATAALLRDALKPGDVLSVGPRPRETATVDLGADPGPWLLRALLALNTTSATLLVPNRHPDLADAAGQAALREIVGAKWTLRFRRGTPGPQQAIVEATATAPGVGASGGGVGASGGGGGGAAHWLLTHAHGKVGNVLREALIRADGGLTRDKARAMAAEFVERPAWLEARLLDLPRHAVAAIVRALMR